MSSMHMVVAELHYDADDRHAIAAALSDVAVQLELVRLTVLAGNEEGQA